jgi:antitoxin PrlF
VTGASETVDIARRIELEHYRGNITTMAIAHSKVTAQGQISVPAEIRRKLGIGPGSILEWDEAGEHVVVRRAGRYSSEDVHRALFPRKAPAARSVSEMKDGVRRYLKKRHARR